MSNRAERGRAETVVLRGNEAFVFENLGKSVNTPKGMATNQARIEYRT